MAKKVNKRLEAAYSIVLERVDYVIDHYVAPDFCEFVCSIGGDVIKYRVYDDGTVYER